MPDTIYINGKFFSQRVTGVQRYALEVIRQMDELLQQPAYRDLRLVCLVPPGEYPPTGWKKVEVRVVGANQDNLWEQLDLPLSLHGGLLFSPGNTGPIFYANQVVTIHDASTFAVPEAYSKAFRAKYWLIFNVLARISRLVLTDSRFSQKELARYLGLTPERFQVILLGGDHLNETPADISILERSGLSAGTYFLTVASQSAHKNFASVLQVAAGLASSAEFVAAGGSFKQVFQQSETGSVPPNVRMLGYVNDSELKALYENARGYILPSRYEGFGLPVLEAMNCACPVLCSNAASLPEVGGNAVLYFDPLDAASLASVLREYMADVTRPADLRRRGSAQAQAFTWQQTARKTLDALVSCL